MAKGANLDEPILRAIKRLADAAGYPPSVREVGTAVGLAVGPLHRRLVLLAKAGLLSYCPNKARTLQVTPEREVADVLAPDDGEAS